jgi:hypothetical protein
MDNFFTFILLCGVLLYAYDLFFLREKTNIKKDKKKNKKIIIDTNNEDANSLEEVLTILDK